MNARLERPRRGIYAGKQDCYSCCAYGETWQVTATVSGVRFFTVLCHHCRDALLAVTP